MWLTCQVAHKHQDKDTLVRFLLVARGSKPLARNSSLLKQAGW